MTPRATKRYVALLRAVNVGGRKVVMADLRAVAEELGLTAVSTLLASGNLVFSSDDPDPAALERRLEAEAERRLGLKIEFLVRDAIDLARVLAANPFHGQAAARPNHLFVYFHREPIPAAWLAALRAEHAGREVLAVDGRELFVDFKDVIVGGFGGSTLVPLMARARHRRLGTARNWNTVTRLAALLA